MCGRGWIKGASRQTAERERFNLANIFEVVVIAYCERRDATNSAPSVQSILGTQ